MKNFLVGLATLAGILVAMVLVSPFAVVYTAVRGLWIIARATWRGSLAALRGIHNYGAFVRSGGRP
jgi:hypothetical protein